MVLNVVRCIKGNKQEKNTYERPNRCFMAGKIGGLIWSGCQRVRLAVFFQIFGIDILNIPGFIRPSSSWSVGQNIINNKYLKYHCTFCPREDRGSSNNTLIIKAHVEKFNSIFRVPVQVHIVLPVCTCTTY